MTWHKLNGGTIAMTGDRPATERLGDGRWVSGFDVLPADDPLIAQEPVQSFGMCPQRGRQVLG